VGKPTRGNGTKLMAVANSPGLPVAGHTASAAPHERTLVPDTLPAVFAPERPQRLSGDPADESAPLAAALAAVGVEMIAPPRAHRNAPKTQEGRPWRRYKRRWTVARRFARRQHCRRGLVRDDYHSEHDLGFVHLGCSIILLRCYR
jgi:hypothetical protein